MFYPKVLIIGQTFNDFSGGGITLSSLFKDWPKERLANLSYPFMIHNSTTKICDTYYQIGKEEISWRFPFYLFKQKFESGRLRVPSHHKISVIKESRSMRHYISSNILTPLMRWTGMVHFVSSINLSGSLKDFLSDFSPQIVYLQISNYESIRFSIDLIDYLQIPSVLHMMDDWPSTLSSSGLFKKYWHKVIDREFRVLLGKTDLPLSISDAMSEEYLTRYGRRFIPFHNSIESERFNLPPKGRNTKSNTIRILYVGRMGTANCSSLLSFAKGISDYDFPGYVVEFDIYTKDYDCSDAQKIRRFGKVKIFEAVEHADIPALLVSYDVLLLPLDFTEAGLKFSKFSMPTKAIEYMASGTPILVYAPSETAISRFCKRNECAYCIVSPDPIVLANSLANFFTNPEYGKKLAFNAKRISRQFYDSVKVRQEFRSTLSHLLTGQE